MTVANACYISINRNIFAAGCVKTDKDGLAIQWEHIQILHHAQEAEGLRLANKLTKNHVHFDGQKMKVCGWLKIIILRDGVQ